MSPEAPASVSISPRRCYYSRARPILVRRWQLWSRSSHPALRRFQTIYLYPLWPLPPEIGAPQSPGLVVPDGSILVEPHAESPSETIPPAESPAPPNRCPPASLRFLPPVGPAPRHPSEVGSTPPLRHQLNPTSILSLGVALTQPMFLVYYTIHLAALSNPPTPPPPPQSFREFLTILVTGTNCNGQGLRNTMKNTQ